MTRDDLNRLAIVARVLTEGDVRPEDTTSLHATRIDIPGAGWTERETGLPPPEDGSFARGLGYALPIAVALWIVVGLIGWVIYLALRWGGAR